MFENMEERMRDRMQGARGTKPAILRALSNTIPRAEFGICELFDEERYIPPSTIWERIKQVFTGPRIQKLVGEAEICVLTSTPLSEHERASVHDVVEWHRPAGTVILVHEFERGSDARRMDELHNLLHEVIRYIDDGVYIDDPCWKEWEKRASNAL